MKIDSIKTYRTAFQMLSASMMVIVVVCIIALGGLGFLLFKESQKGYETVWIIDPQTKGAYKAQSVLSSTNPERIFEYKNQVEMFYKNWYEFDQFTYKKNIEKGLTLVANCGKDLYNVYKTQDMQRKLAEKNMKAQVQIDSIFIDMNSTPVRGVAYAIQKFESPAGMVERHLNSKFIILDLEGRSEENPHGCLIENFMVFDDSKIEN